MEVVSMQRAITSQRQKTVESTGIYRGAHKGQDLQQRAASLAWRQRDALLTQVG
jgi:hypothetical protein